MVLLNRLPNATPIFSDPAKAAVNLIESSEEFDLEQFLEYIKEMDGDVDADDGSIDEEMSFENTGEDKYKEELPGVH
jgi:hypothetical protein